ncbi:MAG TPA: alpha/beta fold hydrolase [Caulobacter sp.]|nr:alpha/beta fold hydrolase [Caulobacter sp.]
MARKRPKGVLELGWAAWECDRQGRIEHVPLAELYDENQVRRISMPCGGGHGWTLSALTTPREKPAPVKIVVVTGAPSWAEYWAPVLAALPEDREMIVVDRPGYAGSGEAEYVGDIRVQAESLMPLLATAPGQKLVLVGQSYGAAISSLMAARRPKGLAGLVLLSGYFGDPGPTARFLVRFGQFILRWVPVPRDLRNAVLEVAGQPGQLVHMLRALERITVPIHVIHGDKDDFAPIETAERLVQEVRTLRPMRFRRVPDADHFLNDGPADDLIAELEACLPVRAPLHVSLVENLRLLATRTRRGLQRRLTAAGDLAATLIPRAVVRPGLSAFRLAGTSSRTQRATP